MTFIQYTPLHLVPCRVYHGIFDEIIKQIYRFKLISTIGDIMLITKFPKPIDLTNEFLNIHRLNK